MCYFEHGLICRIFFFNLMDFWKDYIESKPDFKRQRVCSVRESYRNHFANFTNDLICEINIGICIYVD